MVHRLIPLLCGLLSAACLHAGGPCCWSGNSCSTNCPDTTVVAALAAYAEEITGSNVISNSVYLQQNQVLFITTDSNDNKYYCPVKRYGGSPLCFYRNPLPSQPLGGWTPVFFSPQDELFQAYFSCNTIPELSQYDKKMIASLFLPGVCCR